MSRKNKNLVLSKRRNWVKTSMDKFTNPKVFKVKKISLLEKELDREMKEDIS